MSNMYVQGEANSKEAISFKLVTGYTTITMKRERTQIKKHVGGNKLVLKLVLVQRK